MDIQTPLESQKIRELNDNLRRTFFGGIVVTTRGVAAMDENVRRHLQHQIQTFHQFSDDNDPHGEHDFGAIELYGAKFFWQISYYDRTMEMGSPDPTNPKVTKRVLTIMRAEEY